MSRPRRAGKQVITSDENPEVEKIDPYLGNYPPPHLNSVSRALRGGGENDDDDHNNNGNEEEQHSSLYVPPPPPTLNIFSKFQERRDDFDPHWVMAEESSAASSRPAIPPIRNILKEKLKKQTETFHLEREEGHKGKSEQGNGMAQPQRNETNKEEKQREEQQHEENKNICTKKKRKTSNAIHARGDKENTPRLDSSGFSGVGRKRLHEEAEEQEGGSGEDEMEKNPSTSHARHSPINKKKRREGKHNNNKNTSSDDNSEDDEEYNPVEKVVVVAATGRKKGRERERRGGRSVSSSSSSFSASSSSSAGDEWSSDGMRKNKEDSTSTTSTTSSTRLLHLKGWNENEKVGGLQGEYISFISSTEGTASIKPEELLVRMPLPTGVSVKTKRKENEMGRGRMGERTTTTTTTKEREETDAPFSPSDNTAPTSSLQCSSPSPSSSCTEEIKKVDGGRSSSLYPRSKEEEEEEATRLFYANFSSSSKSVKNEEDETGRHHPRGSPSSSSSPHRAVAMPLWSAERLNKVGGYADAMLYPTIALHQEVMDVVEFLRPSEAEIYIRYYIAMEVERMAKSLWPEACVVVYGSLRTKLLLPLSDVDITLVNVPLTSPEEALPLLAKVIDAEKFTSGSYPQVIVKTKVPLIKFQHAGSLVDVDISLAALDGKDNTEIVLYMLDRYPEASSLILLIKYFLHQRDMDEPYRGGLGSYATTLLVISFLQHHPIYTTRPEERRCTGLGKLLVDFFRYYGLYWNFNRCRVSVRNSGRYTLRGEDPSPSSFPSPSGGGGAAYRNGRPASPTAFTPTGGRGGVVSPPSSPSSPNGGRGPCQLEIEDPGNIENNAASSVRMFHAISSFFTHAYMALTANGVGVPSAPSFWVRKRRHRNHSDHRHRHASSSSHHYSSNAHSCSSDDDESSSSSMEEEERQQQQQYPLPKLESISPNAADIRLRPTLLSRILHVDPTSLHHRRCIEATYHELCQTAPEKWPLVKERIAEQERSIMEGRKERRKEEAERGGSEGGKGRGVKSPTTTTSSPVSLLDRLRTAGVDINQKKRRENDDVDGFSVSSRSQV